MSTLQTVLISGISGQDGSYLAESLRASGVEVHGIVRPIDDPSEPVLPLPPGCHLHRVDLVDEPRLTAVVDEVEPDAIFHLAGLSSVAQSWQDPVATTRINAVATASMMNAAFDTQERVGRRIAFVNASSSEIFGVMRDAVLTEQTPLAPTSPYGASKAFGHELGKMFRSRGLAVSNAILFNHESPRRSARFVTGKIAQGVAAIASGTQSELTLGDLGARRDWGWAPDYVEAMRRMAARTDADDYVVATGRSHSVRDFVASAFDAVGIAEWEPLVAVDERHMRPVDPVDTVGDASKARRELEWAPSMDFEEIVRAMVQAHLDADALTG